MKRWLVKADPDDYSAADLERDGFTLWTGVRNPVAQKSLRAMTPGDAVLIYHTGGEKMIVARGEVRDAPQPDPTDESGKSVAVMLRFSEWLEQPISLAAVKAEPELKDFALVRQSRLSVMPVSAAEWKILLGLKAGGED